MRLSQYGLVVGILIIVFPANDASGGDKSTFWKIMREDATGAHVVKIQDNGRIIYYLTLDTDAIPRLVVFLLKIKRFIARKGE